MQRNHMTVIIEVCKYTIFVNLLVYRKQDRSKTLANGEQDRSKTLANDWPG